MPKVIGIKFKDNDYTNVAYGFLAGLKHTGLDPYQTKEKVVQVWNAAAEGLYRLYQNPYEYNFYEQPGSIGKYLTIDEDDVFFDKEVDEYLKNEFLNIEFAVIDCRRPNVEPYCYVA